MLADWEGAEMADLTALKVLNANRWAAAKLTRARAPEFGPPAKKAIASKARYQSIDARSDQLDLCCCVALSRIFAEFREKSWTGRSA